MRMHEDVMAAPYPDFLEAARAQQSDEITEANIGVVACQEPSKKSLWSHPSDGRAIRGQTTGCLAPCGPVAGWRSASCTYCLGGGVVHQPRTA